MQLGHTMLIDPRSEEQVVALEEGKYDDHLIQQCFKYLEDGDHCLDIGANIGFYSCAFGHHLKHHFETGHVTAFEPVSANRKQLQKNIRLNELEKWIDVQPHALGTEPGTLTMRIMPAGSTNNAVGDNMLKDYDRENMAKERWRKQKARIIRLDDWWQKAGCPRIKLIKIDVEGAEILVFGGGRELVEQSRPVILGEFSPYWMGQIGHSFQDVIDYFEPLGYSFYKDVEGTFVPVTPENIAKFPEVPNYLLLPEGSSL